jgi:steroid 5-alpha reductase family enzyme
MSPLTQTLLTWLVSIARRDASLFDPFWGTGFVVVAWLACVLNRPVEPRAMLLAVLTTLWGLRLSLFLLWRNWGHGEDRRYRAMRDHWGPRFWWVSYVTVFLLQGVILWFGLDIAGLGLWTVGVLFESLGDWQLARFKADPANAGRVMDRGLWRYTRHPNYFGDFCVWWGLYLIAAAGGAWWTVGSPLLMSLFLMRVSGVTLLEQTIVDRRPDYAAYQRRTNAFFPGLPKGSA